MIPITVTAELLTPPVVTGPILLDAILWAGWHEREGAQHESGWISPRFDAPLPLARVEAGDAWWWACSQVTPEGPEQTHHLHRRAPAEAYRDWTAAPSYNQVSGADKSLRIPMYRRVGMTRLSWTCVGDLEGLAGLLAWIDAIGKTTTQGHGWVRSWRVEPGGPDLSEYGRDVLLRHLPVGRVEQLPPGRVTRRRLPLRAPYHRRTHAVECLQVRQ